MASWSRELTKLGHEVVQFSPDFGAPVRRESHSRIVRRTHQLLTWRGQRAALSELVSQFKPDVMSVHYATSGGSIAIGMRVPSVLTVYGSEVTDFALRSPVHKALVRRSLLSATSLTAASSSLARTVVEVCPEVGDRVAVVPFGVDLERLHEAARQRSERVKSQDVVLGSTKSLESTYGIDTLIRAAAMAHRLVAADVRLSLDLVGDGSLLTTYRALAASLGAADVVRFSGAVEQDDIPERLAGFDIYAALSRRESFGLAVVEAMASGLPCVVSDVGGLPELVSTETGMLIPVEDHEVAARAIVRLALDPSMRRRMGASGQTAASKFGWERVAQQLVAELEHAISAGTR